MEWQPMGQQALLWGVQVIWAGSEEESSGVGEAWDIELG